MNNYEQLKKYEDEINALKELQSYIKEVIQQDLIEHHIETEKTAFVTVSYVNASETISVDMKKVLKIEPALFKDLVRDYPKVSKKKETWKYTFVKEKKEVK